ncbi:MAG TPA: phosphoenolpyruvate synthase [Burkholderiales bacterium]|nr:phosphoenolpyruvate synthase [Burkholderiales bacterium]
MKNIQYVIDFTELRAADVGRVGGKNASLGEMIATLTAAGVRVPGGFATTAEAYREFLAQNGLDRKIEQALAGLDIGNVQLLARTGAQIRGWIIDQPLQPALMAEIERTYAKFSQQARREIAVAVRSSATAEDLPEASFAGQQETFLNIRGRDAVFDAVKRVFASLYNNRAIAYRVHQGFAHNKVALSAGVQRMVESSASGVMFTLDTESGFDQVVLINAAYGLGETVVQGQVNPDEFHVYKPALRANRPAILSRNLGGKAIRMVFGADATVGKSVRTLDVPEVEQRKFCISDAEVEALARHALVIEQHYGKPMDIEWGRDAGDQQLYILQARPETVQSHARADVLRHYHLKQRSEVLVKGRAIGQRIGAGKVKVINSTAEMERVQPGDVLVAAMTDPDWEPVMKRASAIVTDRGGRTCHAAIVARELGIPAVVGCGDATTKLTDGMPVTVSCTEGEAGFVYRGLLDSEVTELALDKLPQPPVKIAMNVGNPELAFEFRRIPNDGVGLARLEFIIAHMIGLHPHAALEYPNVPEKIRGEIERRAAGYSDPVAFYVEKLAEGVATLGAAFWPKPVIVRLSDFKSNEYSSLVGGDHYEPDEENPMIGFRGASRYVADSFRACFELECRALRKVRDEMGLTNVEVMVPFVRTVDEAKKVLEAMDANGLRRGDNGLRVIMMCEIPSNAVLAARFLELFDGFSIGSNDMTQLTLGLDRDSGLVAGDFDERDPAVKHMLHLAIQACRKAGKYIGICGQGPSDHPDLAQWLVEEGIGALSLNPDTVVETRLYLAQAAGAAAKSGAR